MSFQVSAGTLADASDVIESDARVDRRIMVSVAATLGLVIAVYTSVQAVLVLGVFSHALSGATPRPLIELAVRIGINLLALGILVTGVALARPERRRLSGQVVAVLGVALITTVLRGLLQMSVGIYDLSATAGRRAQHIEMLSGCALLVFVQVIGLLLVMMWRVAREGERMRLAAQERALLLLRQLQEEELRIRREIAETIHGSVQGVFVVVEAKLRRLAETAPAQRDELEEIAGQVGALREGELRTLSARLYPVDLARGTDAALRTLLARLSSWLAVADDASDALARAEHRLSLEARVVVVRVVEEGLSNALRHGGAQTITVRARAGADRLTLEVISDGASPATEATASGLARLGRRAEVLGGTLDLRPGQAEGATLRLELPLPA